MARKNTPVLPGLSRSSACSRTCQRLAGHKGDHRQTLTATKSPKLPIKASAPTIITVIGDDGRERTYVLATTKSSPAKAGKRAQAPTSTATEGGVEVLSADRYTPKGVEPKARRARRPKVAGRCRIVKAGVRCSRAYGHKQAGTRHSFAVVRQVAEVVVDRTQIIRGKTSRRRGYQTSDRPSSRLA